MRRGLGGVFWSFLGVRMVVFRFEEVRTGEEVSMEEDVSMMEWKRDGKRKLALVSVRNL